MVVVQRAHETVATDDFCVTRLIVVDVALGCNPQPESEQ
jgi:hypothetical protein